MKRKIEILVLLLFLSAGAFVFTRPGHTQPVQEKTAGEVYKNIQVLKDMPADQLGRVMGIFAASLGVKCDFCHVPGQWEKDDKEEKNTARQMIRMTMSINKDQFNGRTEVSCSTCHAGRMHPSSIPPLGPPAAVQEHGAPVAKETLPTIDQVLEKYTQALGGKDAIAKISTRVMKGSRIGPEGKPAAEEVYEKLPDSIFVSTAMGQGSMTTVSNGTDVWATNGKGQANKLPGDEAEQFKRDVQVFHPDALKTIYKTMAVGGTDKIGDRDVIVVRAVSQSGSRERLYFDKQTGLLVRRYAATPTVIGVFPYQVDYSDYKSVDGVMVPMTIQWSTPGRTWTRKVTEVKTNIPIDDAKFKAAPPA